MRFRFKNTIFPVVYFNTYDFTQKKKIMRLRDTPHFHYFTSILVLAEFNIALSELIKRAINEIHCFLKKKEEVYITRVYEKKS